MFCQTMYCKQLFLFKLQQKTHNTHIALQKHNVYAIIFYWNKENKNLKLTYVSMARKYHTGSLSAKLSDTTTSKCMTHGMMLRWM